MNENSIFNLLVSHSNLNFFSVDHQYRYTSFSPLHSSVIKNIWGIDISIGLSILDIISIQEDKEKAKRNFDQVLQSKEILVLNEEYGDTLLQRNYYQDKYIPIIEDDKVVGVLVVVEEIFINKDLNIFEQIINLPQSGITLADARDETHPLIYVNNGFTNITGYQSEEVLGKNCKFLQNDDRNQKAVLIIKKALQNKVACKVELRNYKKDGTLFYNLLSISPIFNSNGELVYFAGIQNDITPLKKLQDQTFQEDKIDSMKNLLTNIAHQWRQPLSLISTLSSGLLIKNELNSIENVDIKKYANEITATAQYLSSILNQFSKLIIDEEKTNFYIYDLLVEHTLFDRINVVINCDRYISLASYRSMFDTIIKSVLDNSMAAFESIEEKYIFIDVIKKEDFLEISIKDNANGIDEKLLANIFEPYFTTHHQSQGKGLGLYVVDNLIRHIGGTISIENTTFTYNEKRYKGIKNTIIIPF